MSPKFGTSGLRGLVSDLTAGLVADYTRAFLSACPHGGGLFLGRDLRPSSPEIAKAVERAARAEGVEVIDCGALPTPALALAAMAAGRAAVMVTGSHIPADRNGLKFYLANGEISKDHEAAISAALGRAPAAAQAQAGLHHHEAAAAFVQRYVTGFGQAALAGLRIGIYQHSSVARDLMVTLVRALGGAPVPLARSEHFIPVDTEALEPATRDMLAGWCAEHQLDAVISTDGDADRPMVADASGAVVPGDVLGVLTARSLGARIICTPVSSNSMVGEMEAFQEVALTRIGSPYVIAAMEAALARDPGAKVAGYEANGGFLLGFKAEGPEGPMAPLMTRDSLLPILAPLAAARAAQTSLATLVAGLPGRFTAADRISGISSEVAQDFLARLRTDAEARRAFFGRPEIRLDFTDGLRVRFEEGAVAHLRPSGNAPEFRCYAEADSPETARTLVDRYLKKVAEELG